MGSRKRKTVLSFSPVYLLGSSSCWPPETGFVASLKPFSHMILPIPVFNLFLQKRYLSPWNDQIGHCSRIRAPNERLVVPGSKRSLAKTVPKDWVAHNIDGGRKGTYNLKPIGNADTHQGTGWRYHIITVKYTFKIFIFLKKYFLASPLSVEWGKPEVMVWKEDDEMSF